MTREDAADPAALAAVVVPYCHRAWTLLLEPGRLPRGERRPCS